MTVITTPLQKEAWLLLMSMSPPKLEQTVAWMKKQQKSHDGIISTKAQKQIAMVELEKLIQPLPKLDYERALAEYREKKFDANFD